VLDVSRIITGKLHLQVAPVDLGMVVDAALDAVRLAAQAKGIDLQIAIDSTIGLVTGDASRLQQVVWNLLSNAIKFTPAGGRVEIRVERTETAARIVVSDTGRGIEPKFLPYVFDRFRQADSTSTRAHGGLGLGLAIVRHLVELHGGEVRAESAGVGSGATFIVELPLGPSGAALAERTAELPDPHGPRPLSGVRILVVDDERETRELLTVVLKQAGAYVHTVDGASEAFRALEAARPAILLCDIAMPAIDGYTLIRQLRAQGCHVPAVAVTAYGRGEDRGQALAAGFQAYLAKPVDPVDLIGVIAGLVRTAAA
jgi:CheY-like chemotaxis protein/anti-sigma regulatory factor (Ser/Thr protein kinase)